METFANDPRTTICNGLLCYLNTARHELTYDIMQDTVHKRYSKDDIEYSKSLLLKLPHVDGKTRRGSQKPQKDLKDILEILHNMTDKKYKVIFTTDSYKNLPHNNIGLVTPIIVTVKDGLNTINNELKSVKSECAVMKTQLDEINNTKRCMNNMDRFLTEDLATLKSDILTIKDMLFNTKMKSFHQELRRLSLFSEVGTTVNIPIDSANDSINIDSINGDSINIDSTNNASINSDSVNDPITVDNIDNNVSNTSASAPPVNELLSDSAINNIVPVAVNNASIIEDTVNNVVCQQPTCPIDKLVTPEILPSTVISDFLINERNNNTAVTSKPLVNNHPSLKVNTSTPVQEVKKVEDKVPAPSAPQNDIEKDKKQTYSQVTKTIIVNNSSTGQIDRPLIDDQGYTRVISRSKRRTITTGTRKSMASNTLTSCNRYIDLYVGRCNEKVTEEILHEYIVDDLKLTLRVCKKIDSKIPYSSAFKITVNLKEIAKFLNPQSWPEGVVCRNFFIPKN